MWHLPGPETGTTRQLIELISTEVGDHVGIRSVPKLLVRALGPVNPVMRGLAEMSYEFDEPFILDTTKFTSTFGLAGTPLTIAVMRRSPGIEHAGSRRHRRRHRHRRGRQAAKQAWSRRVRYVGGFIQVAFAAFWLLRGGPTIDSPIGVIVRIGSALVVIAVVYGIRVAVGAAPRPPSPEGKHIERRVTTTIGPLLLWLDHLVDIPRDRYAWWILIVGPVVLITFMFEPRSPPRPASRLVRSCSPQPPRGSTTSGPVAAKPGRVRPRRSDPQVTDAASC